MFKRVLIPLAMLFAYVPLALGGSLQITVDASNPKWDDGSPVSTNVLSSLYVRIYGAKQGQQKTLLDAQPWAAITKFRRDSTSPGVHCYEAALGLDTNGDKIPDRESAHTAEWCGNPEDAPPVLNLAPPNAITGEAVP